jgi:hypothetical protein
VGVINCDTLQADGALLLVDLLAGTPLEDFHRFVFRCNVSVRKQNDFYLFFSFSLVMFSSFFHLYLECELRHMAG